MGHEKEKTQSLGVLSLWAIGVGLVISGESFGWNIGWGIIGAKSFFVPVLIAATLYFCLVKNLTELTCVYPNSDGPQDFVTLAYGKTVGSFISIILLVEFLFAIPAVANAISEYLGFLSGNHHFDSWVATLFVVVFCAINFFHISLKIKFVIILTILAVLELNIFSFSIVKEFSFENFMAGSHENLNIHNILLALPYAIWMFLAIEGLALFTKYVDYDDFRGKVSSGYSYSIITLFMLCSTVLILAGGSIIWSEEVWGFITSNSHPMPAILATVLGQEHIVVKVFTFLGLFGLVASLQGVVSAAILQFENIILEYSFDSFIKRILSTLVVLIVGLVSIWSSSTGMLIEFSVFAAVSLYFGIGLSLYKLRKQDNKKLTPHLKYQHLDFSEKKSNIYILLSTFISLVCVFAFAYSQTKSFFIFFILSVFYFSYHFFTKNLKIKNNG